VQAVLIPITDRHFEYARKVKELLLKAGLRVEINAGKDRMQAKIRQAQVAKIPYMLVIGDKEQAAEAVAVRQRSGPDLGAMPVADFLAQAQAEMEVRDN
jgi:threonyl-tRNA synthetase